jgi:hypothetical protein
LVLKIVRATTRRHGVVALDLCRQSHTEGMIGFSRNEHLDVVVKIENFKPFVEIGKDIVNEYEVFLNEYRQNIERNVKRKHIRSYHDHPWFGPLNPYQWLIMSAMQ